CDNKMIVGETIYRYRLAQAMAQGYVKNVMRVDAVASKMTFTMQGEVREFSYDEILAMREELWFSKGVALSEVSNQTIIDRSIAIWKEKRKSGVPHQIIASACSIRHACQIVALYKARGLRATHVASEGMSLEERATRIVDYEKGLYDCIVHVGILGEGYDNPKISVAAIFRPYRSLSPYAQFVGRTLRWIRGASIDDNLAHVVSHIGLNLHFLWEYYKHESRQAAILSYIDQLFFNEEAAMGMSEDQLQIEMEEIEPELAAEVMEEEIEGYDIDTFLPVPGLDTSYIGRTVQRTHLALATFQSQSFREQSRMEQRREYQERLFNHRQRSGRPLHTPQGEPSAPATPINLTLPFHRPDLERRQYRQWLNKEVQRAAGYVMFTLSIPTDDSLIEVIGDGGERNNYEAIIRGINRVVNRLMNKDESNSKRNDWTIEEFQRARPLVAQARDVVLRVLKRNIANRQHRLPF
ncbi:MAG: helicase, partial [Armatimonadota bacterium]|nr:helicase [Armatimonadota bacterium]